ncbi:tRNA-uridine aminocarboxypropyltransferase [Thalassotalea psychrophila]|uniref:tRNA-uridine aminocarboxypropyltransferase n=1 Tax=Thalassotalea psychrophila TaxID=3065647 RepID=A0ABY9U2M5_9GAMM|nr:tRNA-uridine aminocarboxypropyltransferase [Colwelliaceae bacterium SQ149]
MSRQYCTRCQRPLVTCICKLCSQIENDVRVVFLQHPSEEKQAKGTAMLAHLSLQNSSIIIGENFNEDETLNNIINDDENNVLLLYPEASSLVANKLTDTMISKTVILILDGTWKKAYRMYQLSTNLHRLNKITLANDIKSQYVIRKHHKDSDVSSLEACAHALGALEGNNVKYTALLESFTKFNQFQLSLANKNKT